MNNFGQNIKAHRIRLGMTQEDLGDVLGVKKNTVSNWENGNRSPDVDYIPMLCELFGVDADELLGIIITDVSIPIDERKLLDKYRSLPDDYRAILDGILNMLSDRAIKKEQVEEYLYDPPEGIVDVLMSDEQGNPIRRKLTLEEYQFLERLAKAQKEEASSA